MRKEVLLFRILAIFLFLCVVAPLPAASASTTFLQSIEYALTYSPELKAMQEGRNYAHSDITRSRADYLPDVDVFVNTGLSHLNDNAARAAQDSPLNEDIRFRGNIHSELRLTQPIFSGFATQQNVARAERATASAAESVKGSALNVIYNALAAHENVLRQTALVALAQNNVKAHERILHRVQAGYNNGATTTGELAQVRSRHSRAKATLTSYRSSLDAAVSHYVQLVGHAPQTLASIPSARNVHQSLEELRSATLLSNPNIKASLASIKAISHERGVQEGAFYPQVDMVAGTRFGDQNAHTDLRYGDIYAELQVGWNLYNGSEDVSGIQMTSARLRQERQNLHVLMNTLNRDMEVTLSRYKASAEEVKDYKAAKQASRTARDDYFRQFSAGKRSLLDVLDAESDYFYAATQEIVSGSDRLLSAYRLLAITGDLFAALDINPERFLVDIPTTADTATDNAMEIPSTLIHGWGK